MASTVADYVLDNGLTVIDTLADQIHILAADPSNYSDVTANTLGNKTFSAGGAFGSPAAGSPNGRKVASTAFTDGNITTSGTAAKWAVVDSANSRLLANGALASSVAVSSGGTFGLPSYNIRLPGQ
jgi:hypothetical protein